MLQYAGGKTNTLPVHAAACVALKATLVAKKQHLGLDEVMALKHHHNQKCMIDEPLFRSPEADASD
jgi:hypothetical protein